MKAVLPLLIKTHRAATSLQGLSNKKLQQLLQALGDELVASTKALLKANAQDLAKQAADNPAMTGCS
ncbi:hypothetical protein [Paraflavitalea speifideaquila]|uniref:hypothetical protein n=1 Tax=Paraflavitalea speifideaquila TaxID=3076558 RepID=UPI0028EA9AC0|nr:hypothetical protein [Paraflavitalea speifideiaquila]